MMPIPNEVGDCWLCYGPFLPGQLRATVGSESWPAPATGHIRCAQAWVDRDAALLDRFRAEACTAGHHRYPGTWAEDPADPYGDARLWVCAKGCGFVQRAPGYGTGRFLAEHTSGAA